MRNLLRRIGRGVGSTRLPAARTPPPASLLSIHATPKETPAASEHETATAVPGTQVESVKPTDSNASWFFDFSTTRAAIERMTQYTFNDPDYIKLALYEGTVVVGGRSIDSAQYQLACAGDSALKLVFYREFAFCPSGRSSVNRSFGRISTNQHLASVAKRLELDRLAPGGNFGRKGDMPATGTWRLATIVEALLGAIDLDSGFDHEAVKRAMLAMDITKPSYGGSWQSDQMSGHEEKTARLQRKRDARLAQATAAMAVPKSPAVKDSKRSRVSNAMAVSEPRKVKGSKSDPLPTDIQRATAVNIRKSSASDMGKHATMVNVEKPAAKDMKKPAAVTSQVKAPGTREQNGRQSVRVTVQTEHGSTVTVSIDLSLLDEENSAAAGMAASTTEKPAALDTVSVNVEEPAVGNVDQLDAVEARNFAAAEAQKLAAAEAERLAAVEAERLATVEAQRLAAAEAQMLAAVEAERLAAIEAKETAEAAREVRLFNLRRRRAASERARATPSLKVRREKATPMSMSQLAERLSVMELDSRRKMERRLARSEQHVSEPSKSEQRTSDQRTPGQNMSEKAPRPQQGTSEPSSPLEKAPNLPSAYGNNLWECRV